MRTIAVVFAAMVALGAAVPAAQAAQNGVSTSRAMDIHVASRTADEFSSRHWHGHRHNWHGHRGWHGHRHWRGHRHCWHSWRHGRRIVVCR